MGRRGRVGRVFEREGFGEGGGVLGKRKVLCLGGVFWCLRFLLEGSFVSGGFFFVAVL